MRRSFGFTLIELLIAVTILVMISGVAYSAFRSALNVYKRENRKLTMVQKSRIAIERILLDLNNTYMSPNDQDLSFVASDLAEQNVDVDTLTFATISDPTMQSPFSLDQQENNSSNNSNDTTDNKPDPDLVRVAYYIGIDPKKSLRSSSNRQMTETSEAQSRLSLIRATSTNLNLEEVSDFLFGFQSAKLNSNSNLSVGSQEELSDQIKIGAVIDDIMSLNFRYFDGENWLDAWDEQGSLPQAVEVTLTVVDEEDKSKTYTQASVAYLTVRQ